MTIVSAQAQRVTRNYRDVSIADALRQLAEESRDYTIYFLYNELEDFTITTAVKNKPVPEAIRQMIGFYPISMTQGEKGEIYVECIHKTEHHLKGIRLDDGGRRCDQRERPLHHPQRPRQGHRPHHLRRLQDRLPPVQPRQHRHHQDAT